MSCALSIASRSKARDKPRSSPAHRTGHEQRPLFSRSTLASPNRRAILALLATGATVSRVPAAHAAANSAPSDLPSYSIHDARVAPNGRTATVAIRRGGPTAYSCCIRFEIDGGASPRSGAFVFEHDVDEVLVPVILPSPSASASIRIRPFVTYDFRPTIAEAEARIGPEVSDPSPLALGAVTRAWDAPKPRPVAKNWIRDFYSDLVQISPARPPASIETDVHASRTAFRAAGRSLLISKWASIRIQACMAPRRSRCSTAGAFSSQSAFGVPPWSRKEVIQNCALIPHHSSRPNTMDGWDMGGSPIALHS